MSWQNFLNPAPPGAGFGKEQTLTTNSTNTIQKNILEYLSWLQFSKFDFWYLNFGYLEKSVTWTANTYKMSNLFFNWQETIINYSNLFLLIFLYLIWQKLSLKFRNLNFILKIKSLNISSHNKTWTLWNLILPILLINIYYDLSSIQLHFLCSLIIVLSLITIAIYSFYKKLPLSIPGFIIASLPYNSTHIYLLYTQKIVQVLLYISTNRLIITLFLILLLTLNSTTLFMLFNSMRKLERLQAFSRAIEILWGTAIQIVLMLVSVQIVSVKHNEIDDSIERNDRCHINTDDDNYVGVINYYSDPYYNIRVLQVIFIKLEIKRFFKKIELM